MMQSTATSRAGASRLRGSTVARSATAVQVHRGLPVKAETLSLKEWAVTIGALGSGLQTVLLRKGGIREPTFKPEATDFLLFPTSFHSDQALLKPGVAERFAEEMRLEPREVPTLDLSVFAQVTGAWVTDDARVLAATNALHVWAAPFLDARLKWRPKQPVTVLELRAWRLATPLRLTVQEQLFGCFSWIDVALAAQGAINLEGARPAIEEGEFQERQRLLRSAMQQLGAQPLDLSRASS